MNLFIRTKMSGVGNQPVLIKRLGNGLSAFLFDALTNPNFPAQINDRIAVVNSFESGNPQVVLFRRGGVEMRPIKLLTCLFDGDAEDFLSRQTVESIGRSQGGAFHSGAKDLLHAQI